MPPSFLDPSVPVPPGVSVRAMSPHDHAAVIELNDGEVPQVGHLGADGLASLLSHAALAVVATVEGGQVGGFLVAIAPGEAYGSDNYRWFEQRGTDHLYVDRVAVASSARRRGIGHALYDVVEAVARRQRRAEVTCEVNLEPPNPESLAFHQHRGFVEVGQQDTDGGAKTVALLAKPLTDPRSDER